MILSYLYIFYIIFGNSFLPAEAGFPLSLRKWEKRDRANPVPGSDDPYCVFIR